MSAEEVAECVTNRCINREQQKHCSHFRLLWQTLMQTIWDSTRNQSYMHGNRLEMITSQKLARLIEMNESSKSYHVIFAPVRGCIQKCYALRILDSSWRDNLIGGPICLDYMFLTTFWKNRGNPLRPFVCIRCDGGNTNFPPSFLPPFSPPK